MVSAMGVAPTGFLLVMAFSLLAPAASQAREVVPFSGYSRGTIVIKTSQRRLYYVINDSLAIRYPVGVGRAGMGWSGTVYIDGKYIKPGWGGDDAEWRRRVRHSRNKQSCIYRPICVSRLYSYVQRRYHGSV